MRLLRPGPQDTFCLTDDLDDDDPHVIPRYVILSHTWGPDNEEVTFENVGNGAARDRIGYAKLQFCAEQARKDGIDHFWIDTCCINKASEPELSRAIRSMFRWYQNAVKCYVYLADVSSSKRDRSGHCWEKSFRSSRWFKRGWTLQELLAPSTVELFSREGVFLGSKATLVQQIHEITGIPTAALCGRSVLEFSTEERFAWAEKRQTKKPEDRAYCLFGLFDAQLPVLYGEGPEKALRRLKKEVGVTPAQIDELIRKRYDDGRLKIELLSGKSFPLEYCFVNLGIIKHVRDSDLRLASEKSDPDKVVEPISRFSLAARLKVEAPPESHQVSLGTLFELRKQKDGTQSRPKRVLIWGRAGMGKTTLCKKIVHEVCKNRLWKDLYDRVIWLPLRRLKKTASRTTVELLESEFSCTRLGERVYGALNEIFRDERTLFLLDGLDEVSLALEQDSPGELVLHELLSRSHVIITSRPHSTRVLDHQPPDFELETVGFSQQQIEEYLQQVARQTIQDTKIEEIQSFIQQRPLVRSLAAIPVQLDAICYTWNAKNFPRDSATMTSLYLAISQSLWENSALRLGKTDDDGKLITKQQLDYWTWRYFKKFIKAEITFLLELAFRGLCEEVIEFSVEDTDILNTSRHMPSDKIIHLAFLRVSDSSVDADDRTFHFIHLTFQEFFAAQYFASHWTSNKPLPLWDRTVHGRLSGQSAESITPEEFVQSRKYVDRYDIFWRYVVGLLRIERNKEHLCRFLDTLESEPIDLVGLAHQRLVIHCLSELSAADYELRGWFQQLEDRYLRWAVCESRLNRSCEGPYGRAKSTSLIREAECPDYILERLLNEGETEDEVLDILRRRSSISSKLLDTVVQKLGEITSEDVRNITIQIVGLHCGHDQKEKVFNLFQNRQCSRITPFQIIYAWVDTSRLLEPAVEILIELLQDPDRNVRANAADALRRQAILPSRAIETLIQLLQYRGQDVRSAAAGALRRQATLPSTAIEALIQLLQDPDQDVLYKVVGTLGGHTALPSTAIEALIKLLQHPDQKVRYEAACALRRQATLPSTAIEALIQLLQYRDRNVRYWAAGTLGQVTLPSKAIEALVQLLQHPDGDIQCMTAGALGEQATLPSTAIKALVQLLQDPDPNVQSRAAGALGQQAILPSTAIEALIQLRQHPDQDVRSEAAGALGGLTTLPSMATEALVQLLQDPDWGVRFRAASALRGQTTLPSTATEVLVKLLQDPDPNVRYRAVGTLRRQAILPSTAIEALVQLLRHPDWDVRSEAADALGGLTTLPSTAIEALIQLLQDPDQDVLYKVVGTLGGHTALPSTAIEALIKLLQHPDQKVRSEAACALRRQVTLPSTTIEALVQLLRHPDWDIRSRAASTLGRQAILSSMAIEALIKLLQHTDWGVRCKAADALRGQVTLPSTAIEALVQLLQRSGEPAYEEAVDLIASRQEIRSLVPTFGSSMLQHFVKHWFITASVTCFIEKGCFCVGTSEHFQRIPLAQNQLERFRAQWRKARDDVGIPSLMPVFSTSVGSRILRSIL